MFCSTTLVHVFLDLPRGLLPNMSITLPTQLLTSFLNAWPIFIQQSTQVLLLTYFTTHHFSSFLSPHPSHHTHHICPFQPTQLFCICCPSFSPIRHATCYFCGMLHISVCSALSTYTNNLACHTVRIISPTLISLQQSQPNSFHLNC